MEHEPLQLALTVKETMMERKLLHPMDLTDAEIDVVSGGHFVGIKQSNGQNKGGTQTITTQSGGNGAATTTSAFNSAGQFNFNSGAVHNSGAISGD